MATGMAVAGVSKGVGGRKRPEVARALASGTEATLGTEAESLYLWLSWSLGRQDCRGRRRRDFICGYSREAWAEVSGLAALLIGWRLRGRQGQVAPALAAERALALGTSAARATADGQPQKGRRHQGRQRARASASGVGVSVMWSLLLRGQQQRGSRRRWGWQRRWRLQTVSGGKGGVFGDDGRKGNVGRRIQGRRRPRGRWHRGLWFLNWRRRRRQTVGDGGGGGFGDGIGEGNGGRRMQGQSSAAGAAE